MASHFAARTRSGLLLLLLTCGGLARASEPEPPIPQPLPLQLSSIEPLATESPDPDQIPAVDCDGCLACSGEQHTAKCSRHCRLRRFRHFKVHSAGGMPQHTPYQPWQMYYYMRPYNASLINNHRTSRSSARPYSNNLFAQIYAQFEAQQRLDVPPDPGRLTAE